MFHGNTFIGTVFVFLSALCYAFLPIFTRWIYEYDTDSNPWAIVVWRFIIGTITAWGLVFLSGQYQQIKTLSRQEVKILLLLGGVFAGAGIMAAVSLERIPATSYILLLYTYPAIVAVLAKLIGETLGLQKWASVGLAFIGCLLTISAPIKIGHPTHLLFPLINASAYATYLVIAGRFNVVTGLTAATISITGTLMVLLPLGLFTSLAPPADNQAQLALFGLGTVATVFPIIFMFKGISYIGSINASILSTIEPVMTLIFASILLGEILIWQQGIGGALILMSVLFLHLRIRNKSIDESLQPSNSIV